MKEKINIAELLKDCPIGMELDCALYEDCYLFDIDAKSNNYLIKITTPVGIRDLDKYGCYTTGDKSKCVIFPKGKTTWEGFVPPGKFKDGDILVTDLGSVFYLNSLFNTDELYGCYAGLSCDGSFRVCEPYAYKECCSLATEKEKKRLFQAIKDNGYEWNAETKTLKKLPKFNDGDIVFYNNTIAIFKEWGDETLFKTYVVKYLCCDSLVDPNVPLFGKGIRRETRFATEEEKEILFQAIKNNGYKWNSETKTLEELVKPKFKVRDWVTDGISKCQIYFIDDTHYWYSETCILGSIESVDKQYHLWTIKDAKDGDVIFYDDGWTCIFKSIHGIWYSSYGFITSDGKFHTGYKTHVVDSTINGNAHPATKEQCNILFQKIKEAGYEWNIKIKTLKKLPKFKVGDVIQDIDSYKVKITEVNIEDECYGYESTIAKGIGGIGCIGFNEQDKWKLVPNKFDINTLKLFDKVLVRCSNNGTWVPQFFAKYRPDSQYPFVCTYNSWSQCVPYENNEHLYDTTNNCSEFYKIWEE